MKDHETESRKIRAGFIEKTLRDGAEELVMVCNSTREEKPSRTFVWRCGFVEWACKFINIFKKKFLLKK